MKTIVLAGGGTAGHIMPHVALYKYLSYGFDKIYYIGSGKEIENKLISPLNIETFVISPPKFYRKLTPKNLLIPFKMKGAVRNCTDILQKIKPDVVFSKGGYCALPVCIAAKKLHIPIVCHESDITIGLANKITKKWAAALCTTFEQTAKKYGGIYCGPPLNDELLSIDKKRAKAYLGIDTNKPILLVTGGSQGSRTINYAVEQNIDKLTECFFIIHLCGKGNKPLYRSINGYLPLEFGNMTYCMSAADICVSRGGSNTLFELLCSKKPSLIVPLKKGSRGDQQKNADYFYENKAIMLRDEESLSANILSDTIELYNNRKTLIKNIENLNIQNGTPKIYECILNAVKN